MASVAAAEIEAPPITEVLRELARTLACLGVLVLHLADSAEAEQYQADGDPLLTVAEASAELRCSESLVRTACQRGHLRAMRNGGWRIRRSALRAYERRRTTA